MRNTDENGPGLLEGGGCPRTVLLRYPGGGHCCFAAGLLALLGLGAWKLSDVSRLLLPWSAALLAAGALFAQGAGVAVGPVLMALLLNVGEVSILTAVALFFSSFSTPFLTGAFTLGVWLAGRSADSMQTMRSPLLGDAIVAVLHGLARVVPNFNLFVPGPGTLGDD